MKLRCRDRVLALDHTVVMGVLNVTPDSFSDGGRWSDPGAARAHAERMVSEGAEMVDIGGESTRPGAEPVPQDEELRRVLPVVEAVASSLDVVVSIDTRKAAVAARAVSAGAAVVNDTRGESDDGSLDEVAADTGAALVLMHSRGTPATMSSLTDYGTVTRDVCTWLQARAERAEAAGVGRDAIALDPGIGFAKTAEQSLGLLRGVPQIVELGYPLVVGTSRKSFIGAVLDLPVDRRLEGTLASVAWAATHGAHIVRVHDVEAATRTVAVIDAIRSAQP